MDNRILLPLDGAESVDEILLYATSITPSEVTEIALLTVITGNNTTASGDAHATEIFWSGLPNRSVYPVTGRTESWSV